MTMSWWMPFPLSTAMDKSGAAKLLSFRGFAAASGPARADARHYGAKAMRAAGQTPAALCYINPPPAPRSRPICRISASGTIAVCIDMIPLLPVELRQSHYEFVLLFLPRRLTGGEDVADDFALRGGGFGAGSGCEFPRNKY
jgi:hypothetical protein